jgi:hypothetical protein
MRMPAIILFFTLCVMPGCLMAAVDAAPKKLGAFKAWEAYETSQNTHSTCYMILRPAKTNYKITSPQKIKLEENSSKKPKISTPSVRRSDVYLMVTFRPSESMNPVVSYTSGYIFKQGSEVSLSAGDKPFNLFTQGDQAWARNVAMDKSVTNSLRKAKRVIIQGGSNNGGTSSDIFDPDGVENAYKAVVKACGIT